MNSAIRRAKGNEAFAEDLFQEAMLELTRVDPSRLTRSDEPWLNRKLTAAMARAVYQEEKYRDRIVVCLDVDSPSATEQLAPDPWAQALGRGRPALG